MTPHHLAKAEYHIFLASPTDVSKERQHVCEFFERFNHQTASHWGVQFTLLTWEKYATSGAGRPQEIISRDTIEKYRDSLVLFIGVMGQRFGTPTGEADSGTEEEFDWAINSWKTNGQPEIKWFFRTENNLKLSRPEEVDEVARQWRRVQAFKERMTRADSQIFFREYKESERFREVFENDLTTWLWQFERKRQATSKHKFQASLPSSEMHQAALNPTREEEGSANHAPSDSEPNAGVAGIHSPTHEKDQSSAKIVEFIRQAFEPLCDTLHRDSGVMPFLLCLHPCLWEPFYCGLQADPRPCPEAAERILSKLKLLYPAAKDIESTDWHVLDRVAAFFEQELDNSSSDIRNGAVSILTSRSDLEMGAASRSPTPEEPPTSFVRKSVPRKVPGWFQVALDLAASPLAVDSTLERYKTIELNGARCLPIVGQDCPERLFAMLVDKYVRRPGLLKDRIPIFLAEYLLYRTSRTIPKMEAGATRPSDLGHYFLPMRSNGQWRSTLGWFTTDGTNETNSSGIFLKEERTCWLPSNETRDQLSIICSQIYLEAFSVQLQKGTADPGKEPLDRVKAFYRALRVLWWAEKFWFFRSGQQVFHVEPYDSEHRDVGEREGDHSLISSSTGRRPPKRIGKLLRAEEVRLEDSNDRKTFLTIDLNALREGSRSRAIELLGADLVLLELRLFQLRDGDEKQHLSEISKRLESRFSLL